MITKFFISLIILFTMTSNIVLGMKDDEETRYTVGIKIPNTMYEGKAANPIHMTITYLGTADEKKLEKAKVMLAIINKLRPIVIKIGKPDIFGTQEDPAPVIRLTIENSEIENLLIQMHKEIGICEPSRTEKLEVPCWHVTVKDPQLQKEFSDRFGDSIIGGKLFIKLLGDFKPIAIFE